MSRITRARLEPGDALTSTNLNARYSDYTQTAALNATNLADGAVDSEQMPPDPVLAAAEQHSIGTTDIEWTTFTNYARTTAGPPTRTVLGTTPALGSGLGITLASTDILRVNSTLTCRSFLGIGFTPHIGGNLGCPTFRDYIGSPVNVVSIGAHAWLVQLEWDITDNSLANFESLPDQGDFQSTWRSTGLYGEDVANLAGTGLIPLCWAGATAWSGGEPDIGSRKEQNTGIRAVQVDWVRTGTAVTVYGLRLVLLRSLVHPYNASSINGLVADNASSFVTTPIFAHGPGNLLVMHMRGY